MCLLILLSLISQISNMRIDPASPRSEKNNILHGSTAESVLGKIKLAALTKPFLVHLRNGKVRALALLLVALDFYALILVLNNKHINKIQYVFLILSILFSTYFDILSQ